MMSQHSRDVFLYVKRSSLSHFSIHYQMSLERWDNSIRDGEVDPHNPSQVEQANSFCSNMEAYWHNAGAYFKACCEISDYLTKVQEKYNKLH